MHAHLRLESNPALLLDIDGVLHVGDEPIPGAVEALAALRGQTRALRLVTNTTSRSRAEIVEDLTRLGFTVEPHEVLTPAALAVAYCDEHDLSRVRLIVNDSLRVDLEGLTEANGDDAVDAVVLGDIGDAFNAVVLNDAFRLIQNGARLIALQHNRYWQHAEGLRLDVGAYAAALEYATQQEAVIVGKPSADFFEAALADVGAEAIHTVMVGDDIEADVSGAQAVGIDGVLVRTGKYRPGSVSGRGFGPAATIDSIADLPDLLS